MFTISVCIASFWILFCTYGAITRAVNFRAVARTEEERNWALAAIIAAVLYVITAYVLTSWAFNYFFG